MKKVLVYLDPATGTINTLPDDHVIAVSKYEGEAERPYLIRHKDAESGKAVIVQSKDAAWIYVANDAVGEDSFHPGDVREIEHVV